MDIKLKKLMLIMSVFLLPISSATAALMNKADFTDILAETMVEKYCITDYMGCFELTQTSCQVEIKKIVVDSCSSNMPEEIEDLDEVRSLSADMVLCVTEEFVSKHVVGLVNTKQANKPSCKEITK